MCTSQCHVHLSHAHHWLPAPCKQVGLLEGGKRLLFEPTFAALFGARCCGRHRVDQLQRAFFRVEAGFELAASPLPHLLQRGFLSCREKLLSAFRQASLCLLSAHSAVLEH